MESSKEKIEAQLCAYVEGELDDAERAEIEQHLAANPQHQALIAELRAASGLLRDLPRVAAPMDLNESLCGQIERGALLDPSDDHGTPGMRVNRWPQFTAVAAVLILAVGLGLVIYYVLPPSGGHSRTQLAVDDRSKASEPSISKLSRDEAADAPSGNTRSGEKGNTTDFGADRGRDKALAESEQKSRGADPDGGAHDRLYAMRNAAPANPDLDVARRNLHDRGMVTPSDVESVRKWMNESLGADSNFFSSASNTSLYLVVSTPNTAAVNGQLAAYFKGNGILYMADETRPAAGRGTNGRAASIGTGADDYALSTTSPQAGKTFSYGSAGFGGGGGGSGLAAGGGTGGAGPAVALAGTPQLQPTDKPAPAAAVPAPSAKPGFSSAAGGRAMQRAPETTKKETSPDAEKSDVARADDALKQLSKAATVDSKQREANQDAITADKAGAVPSTRSELEGAVREADVRARRALTAKESLSKDSAPSSDKLELRDGDNPTDRARRPEEESIRRNNVIIARMNRRQLNELSAELSREQGQRAEVLAPSRADGLADASAKAKAAITSLGAPLPTESQSREVDPKALTLNAVVPATLTPAKPAAPASRPTVAAGAEGLSLGTDNQPAAAAGPADERFNDRPALVKNRVVAAAAATQLTMGRAATDGQTTWEAKAPTAPAVPTAAGAALHLKIDPMDEPVDVVIVVKAAEPSAAGAAAVEATTPAAESTGKPAPAGTTDLKK